MQTFMHIHYVISGLGSLPLSSNSDINTQQEVPPRISKAPFGWMGISNQGIYQFSIQSNKNIRGLACATRVQGGLEENLCKCNP